MTAGLARLTRLSGLMVTMLLTGLRLLLLTTLLLTRLRLLTGLWLLARLSHSVLVQLRRRLLLRSLLGVRRLQSLLSRRMEHAGGATGGRCVGSHWRAGRLLRGRLSRLALLRSHGLEAIHGGGLDRGRRVARASASRAASTGATGR